MYIYFMVVQKKKMRRKEYSMKKVDIYERLTYINNFMVVQKKNEKKEYSMKKK